MEQEIYEVSRKKINDIKVHKIKGTGQRAGTKALGHELFDLAYCSISIYAKTMSGKTTTIFEILKNCAGQETIVIFIVSTLFEDPSYKAMCTWLKKHGIQFIVTNSFKDESGRDQLKELVKFLKQRNHNKDWDKLLDQGEEESESEDEAQAPIDDNGPIVPELMFIIDDISEELPKERPLVSLLKENRHFKSKVIVSTQDVIDIPPGGRQQFAYSLLFPQLPENRVEDIHAKMKLSIPLELFMELYADATAEPYNFLYVDAKKGKYRKNFNEAYTVSSPSSSS